MGALPPASEGRRVASDRKSAPALREQPGAWHGRGHSHAVLTLCPHAGGRLMAAGIRTRHSAKCASYNGGRCNCKPSYEAWVYSKRDDKKIRSTFKSQAEAKSWRTDAEAGVRQRTLRAPSKVTL